MVTLTKDDDDEMKVKALEFVASQGQEAWVKVSTVKPPLYTITNLPLTSTQPPFMPCRLITETPCPQIPPVLGAPPGN